MGGTRGLGALFSMAGRDILVAWLAVVVLLITAGVTVLDGAFNWTIIALAVAGVVVAPAVVFRDPGIVPPWELVCLVVVPVLWQTLLGQTFATEIPRYLVVAALALLLIAELDQFTSVRMTYSFAVVVVVLATLAIAGLWHVLQWLADLVVGTSFVLDGRSQDAINADVMIEFVSAGVAGLGAGLLFELYFRGGRRSSGRTSVPPGGPERTATADETTTHPDRTTGEVGSTLQDRLHISPRRQRQASRAMQLALAGLFLWGLAVRDLQTAVNAGLLFAITFAPAVLEREYDLPMDAGLALWITAAAFLHAFGAAGLYTAIGPLDRITHTLSASVVAAAGYAVFRAVDVHTDEVYIPTRLMALFILLVVLAAGVVWEIFEFAVDSTATALGIDAVLIQYGIDDTMGDLLSNVVGALIVTVWGTAYLTDVSDSLAERFSEWFGSDEGP